MAYYQLTASFTEADTLRVTWLKKVGNRHVVPTADGVWVYFTSPLALVALRTKASVMKKDLALQTSHVQELKEEDWLQLSASTSLWTVATARRVVATTMAPTGCPAPVRQAHRHTA